MLVGTAHVSRESQALVRRVIEERAPDCVCVELDERRHEALAGRQRFEELDLREVLRRRQLPTLALQLVLASYQRHLGGALGVVPGAELLEAAEVARARGIPVRLCDRDLRITLRRAWRATAWWRRGWLLAALLGSLFERRTLDEDELRELRRKDVLSSFLDELGAALPGLKRVLIDERDLYLAQRIREAPGQRIVAVLGAGHLAGVAAVLRDAGGIDLAPLEALPRRSNVGRWLGWGVPAVVLGALVAIGVRHGVDAARDNLLVWILANGVPSSLGALVALAHPVTTLVAFAAAPLTSLTPVIGVGYVAAFVQAWLRPPLVREIESAVHDVRSAPAWWRNRLLRVLLVFVLTTIGSLLGTWFGGAEILSNLP